MSSKLKLLTLFLAPALLFAPGIRLISDGLCQIVRGLRQRDQAVRADGWTSVIAGITVIVAAYRVGVPLLVYWVMRN